MSRLPIRAQAPARHVESLEGRRLLSAGAPQASESAAGLARVSWNGQESLAKAGEWVVQFDNGAAGRGLARLNSLLKQARNDIQAVAELGDGGLALIKSPVGLSHGVLQRALRRLPGFDRVEPNFTVELQSLPNDTSFGEQYGLHNTGQAGGLVDADIDAPEAWDRVTGGAGVVVAVTDTGVDYDHADLADNIWINPGETGLDALGRNKQTNGLDDDLNGYSDDFRGWDFSGTGDNAPDDTHNGHGTHVAGIIAASGNNGIGVTGVSWDTDIMPLRIFGNDGTATLAGIVSAIDYATNMRQLHGVNVGAINASWGGTNVSGIIGEAIAKAGDAGILFVAAAGNGGTDNVADDNDTMPFYPASYNLPNVIAVASTDNRDVRAGNSNYGATSVDLAAPGVNVLSTLPNNTYGRISGTSMAAPQVAGAIALAYAAAPAATPEQVRTALFNGVDRIASLQGKMVTGGRLNAAGALTELLAVTSPPPPAAVAGRHVFYNNSAFDGNGAAADARDDAAVDAGKSALLPGQTAAAAANVTAYSRGINGVMVDVTGLPQGAVTGGLLGPQDVAVRTTSPAAPDAWSAGPAPTSVTVRAGAGVGGSDRVTLVWPDGAIVNRWVEVTLLANADTRLPAPDVFAFGNLIGDADGSRAVNLADFGAQRQDFNATGRTVANGQSDFNRDGAVNLADFGTLRSNFGKSLPAAPASAATSPDGAASASPAVAFTPTSSLTVATESDKQTRVAAQLLA